MGEAEEHQERPALEVLIGDGAAVLVPQAEVRCEVADAQGPDHPILHEQRDGEHGGPRPPTLRGQNQAL